MKTLYLTHQSALHALSQPASAAWPIVRMRRLDTPAYSMHDLRKLDVDSKVFGPPPYHVLVPDAHLRSCNDVCKPHVVSGTLPEESFLQARPGVYVALPELCFALLTSSTDLVRGVELGLRLCGSYLRDPYGGDGLPACSVHSVTRYLTQLGHCGPRSKPGKALKFLVDGSASPMETALVMLLCLPVAQGGFGLPMPELNPALPTNREAAKATGCAHLKPDLYYRRAHLGIEYDSDFAHTGSARISRDSVRRLGLKMMGLASITVTKRQLYSIGAFQPVAIEIMRAIGLRPERRRLPDPQRQDELRRILLPNYEPCF